MAVPGSEAHLMLDSEVRLGATYWTRFGGGDWRRVTVVAETMQTTDGPRRWWVKTEERDCALPRTARELRRGRA